ncbi:MAG: hypothetical protein JWP50_3260 [Phenylobacterium sp.]|nr:hypothetical protein [Phenylobacterium sp.]
MPLTDWQTRLAASPELFPLAIDPAIDRVRLVRMAPVDYEKASFLDERLTAPGVAEPAFAEVEAAMARAPVACDYIFHLGHVGSTLLSRLLGVHPAVFSLREPQPLRTFAAAEAAGGPWSDAELDRRLRVFQALFSRTWAPPQRALVKATSLVSGLAPRLMAQNPAGRALLMTLAPEAYLAAIFSGANLGDVRQAAALRLARLNRRVGAEAWRLDQLSPGELVAMSWASDRAVFADLARRMPERVLVVDFEAFLAAPAESLTAALAHLHGRRDPEAAARLAASPYLQRYSKAPEYGYGADLRRQVLAEARRTAAEEIRRGLAWLEGAARDWPAIAEAAA